MAITGILLALMQSRGLLHCTATSTSILWVLLVLIVQARGMFQCTRGSVLDFVILVYHLGNLFSIGMINPYGLFQSTAIAGILWALVQNRELLHCTAISTFINSTSIIWIFLVLIVQG